MAGRYLVNEPIKKYDRNRPTGCNEYADDGYYIVIMHILPIEVLLFRFCKPILPLKRRGGLQENVCAA